MTILQNFKAHLSTCYYMKDLGLQKYFLGIEVVCNNQGIYLCQRKYALDILSDASFLGAKPLGAKPLGNKITNLAGLKVLYCQILILIDALWVALTITRPDLSYFVQVLSHFVHQPRQDHWNAAFRVLRYIKTTPGQDLFLRANSDIQLQA